MIEILVVITLYWSPPEERTNGEAMSADEVGGYEIRQECPGDVISVFQTENLSYRLEGIDIDSCEFYVAVYDTNGIYSEFVKAESARLSAPTRGGIR